MIEHNTLILESDWGEHWNIKLNLVEAFPTTKAWIRQFDKLIVKRSKHEPLEHSVWEQIAWYLKTHWKDENLKLIEVKQRELERYEELAACGNKEDKHHYKRLVADTKQIIKLRKKKKNNESKTKENIEFIEQNFIARERR